MWRFGLIQCHLFEKAVNPVGINKQGTKTHYKAETSPNCRMTHTAGEGKTTKTDDII